MSEEKKSKAPVAFSKNITKKGKIKLKTIAEPNFQVCLGKLSNYDFGAGVGYWVGRVINKITSIAKEYEATRVRALKKYAKLNDKTKELDLDDKGLAVFLDDDSEDSYFVELKDLQEQEVECLMLSTDAILKEADKEKIKIPGAVWNGLDEILY